MIILFCAFFNRKSHYFCAFFKKSHNCFDKSTKYDVDFLLFFLIHTAQLFFSQLTKFARQKAFIQLKAAYRQAFERRYGLSARGEHALYLMVFPLHNMHNAAAVGKLFKLRREAPGSVCEYYSLPKSLDIGIVNAAFRYGVIGLYDLGFG